MSREGGSCGAGAGHAFRMDATVAAGHRSRRVGQQESDRLVLTHGRQSSASQISMHAALNLPLELLELLRAEWPLRTKSGEPLRPLSPSSPPARADSCPTLLLLEALGPLSSSALAQYKSLLFCEPSALLRYRFAALLQLAHEHISAQPYAAVPTSARRFYSEVGLLWSLIDALTPDGRSERDWEESIGRLDRVLIIAGAPERIELVLALIEHIQETHLPSECAAQSPQIKADSSPRRAKRARIDKTTDSTSLLLAPNEIPRLAIAPSLSAYLKTWLDRPFILPGHLAETGWPALVDPSRQWKDGDYLLRAGGRGRVVPVEIDAGQEAGLDGGGGYTDAGWGQALLPWEEFLKRAGFLRSDGIVPDVQDTSAEMSKRPPPPLYLAQHDLFFQFPRLARDILTPDYVFASPPTRSDAPYQAPTTESGVITNVWVGDAGRGSPAHTDPYYNCYAQVVGRKRIFLVPPKHYAAMYPYAAGDDNSAPADGGSGDTEDDDEATDGATALMSNTSRLPLLRGTPPSRIKFPRFYTEALPDALEGVLGEGDLLVMPVGWWHAMRMEGGPGWGCSFWY